MATRIGFGLLNYPFDDGRAFFRWVELLENSRVDSVWQSDRLISTDNYLESLSALASLAGCTEKINFGMNPIAMPRHFAPPTLGPALILRLSVLRLLHLLPNQFG